MNGMDLKLRYTLISDKSHRNHLYQMCWIETILAIEIRVWLISNRGRDRRIFGLANKIGLNGQDFLGRASLNSGVDNGGLRNFADRNAN